MEQQHGMNDCGANRVVTSLSEIVHFGLPHFNFTDFFLFLFLFFLKFQLVPKIPVSTRSDSTCDEFSKQLLHILTIHSVNAFFSEFDPYTLSQVFVSGPVYSSKHT